MGLSIFDKKDMESEKRWKAETEFQALTLCGAI